MPPTTPTEYHHDRADEWLAWFMNPETPANLATRSAFYVVPREHWLHVEMRLRVLLDEAFDELQIRAQAMEPGRRIVYQRISPESLEAEKVIDAKRALFRSEVERRQQTGERQ